MPSQPAQNSASPAPSRFRLIVGLGNPGRQYQATRHNIGFMVLDRLAQKWGVAFTAQAKWDAHVAKTDEFLLLKPQTFMNDSGRAVAACAAFYKIPAEETLVIYDEVALPLGKMRLRPGGSAGGHNGMRSIIAHLGTENFPRLRLGIGGADKSSLSGHVLGKFSAEEKPTVDKLLDRSVEAVIFAALRGWAAAMSAFNAEASPRPPKPTRPATPEENPLPPSPDGTAPSDNSQTPKN